MGKKVKKFVKKAVGIVKGAWKAVTKLIDTVVKAITDALQYVWKEVIMPILDFVADLLGFRDQELIQVAANTQALFDEATAWTFNDNIVLKSLMQGTNVVDEMRSTILYGQHNNSRGYSRYGEEHYSRGLPSITISAGNSTSGDRAIMALWKMHCDVNDYVNIFSTVASLPITDSIFSIHSPTAKDRITAEFVELYEYNIEEDVITKAGTQYKIDWNTYSGSFVVESQDPNWDPSTPISPEEMDRLMEIGTLYWTMDTVEYNKYLRTPTVKLVGSTITAPALSRGGYLANGIEPFVDSGLGFGADLNMVDPTAFPFLLTYTDPVEYNYVKRWRVTRTETEVPPVAPATEPTIKVTYALTVDLREGNTTYVHKEVEMIGSIPDALTSLFTLKFKVNNIAFTPYPENLEYEFVYSIPQDRGPNLELTGGGVDDEIFDTFAEDFMDALPVVVLKEEGVWIDTDTGSANFTTSDKLLRSLSMRLQPLVDGVRESSASADNDLQTAAFRLGVDILTKNQGCLKYVFEFFRFVATISVASENDFIISKAKTGTEAVQGTSTNNITLEEGSFVTSYQYSYCSRTTVGFTPALTKKKGFYESGSTNTDFWIVRHNGDGTGTKVFVKNLAGAYVIRVPQASKAKMAAMSFTTSPDEDYNRAFVIPILIGPYRNLTPLQREEVMARSRYLTVTSGTYKLIRWYKTPQFLTFIMIVIVIVVTVLTLGSGTAGALAAMQAAVVAGTYAVAASIAMNMAIQMLIAYVRNRIIALVLEKILKVVGAGEYAELIAAISTAAITGQIDGKSMGEIVMSSALALGNSTNALIQERTSTLIKEVNSYNTTIESIQTEHTEAVKGLEVKNVLGLSALYTYKAETPELFFSRVELDTTEVLASLDMYLGLESTLDYMTS